MPAAPRALDADLVGECRLELRELDRDAALLERLGAERSLAALREDLEEIGYPLT